MRSVRAIFFLLLCPLLLSLSLTLTGCGDASPEPPPPPESVVPILANDLAWDPVYKKIYLSLPSIDAPTGNSVQVVDPYRGSLDQHVFAGSEPNLLSVSQTSKYLYVSLNGSSNVQRLSLPDLAPDIEIPLGSSSFDGPYYAMDMQAAPNADATVAVVRGTPGVSPEEEGGVLIYDDAVARPNVLCGWIEAGCINPGGPALFDSIQWNADASQLYAANYESSAFDFYTIPVSAPGFGTVTDYRGVIRGYSDRIHYDPVTSYLYGNDGEVIDPATGTFVGTFADSGLMVPDGANKIAYFLGQTPAQLGTADYTIESFSMEHFTPILSVTVANVTGSPTHLILWGSNGLAFTTVDRSVSPQTGAVYILSSSYLNGDTTAGLLSTENVQGVPPAQSLGSLEGSKP